MSVGRKCWSAVEEKLLDDLLRARRSHKEIARLLGRTVPQLHYHLRERDAGRVAGDVKRRKCLSCRKAFATRENYRLCESCRSWASNNSHLEGAVS